MKPIFCAATLATTLLACSSAFAARPANVAGTTWTVQANRSVEQLVITHQGGPGTAGGATCLTIIGTIGIAPVRGWYCPSTGRIHFRHNNISTGATVRVFTGSVSDEVIGQPLYMAGTMMIDYATFGELGEYNFSAVN